MMIQWIIIGVGIFILALIFVRRSLMTGHGVKRGVLEIFHLREETDAGTFEVTIEELIPDRSTVDLKKIIKGDALVKKADYSLEKGDLQQGEKMLIQALSLDPSNVSAYKKLGLLYLRQGLFGKAEMMYQKLIASSQNDPVHFSNLALAFYQQKKLEGAKTNYLKAIELDASRPGRFFSLGQVLSDMGETENALLHFKKAAEMDRSNIDYLLTLAQVYIDLKLFSDARAVLDEVLANHPENEFAKEMMGMVVEGLRATGAEGTGQAPSGESGSGSEIKS